MRFRIEQRAFNELLAGVAPTIPRRPAIPLLTGVQIAITGANHVSASVYDFEVAARTSASVTSVAEAGSALVSGRLLAEVAKLLPTTHGVEVFTDSTSLHVGCDEITFTLPLMPIDDYPVLPPVPDMIGTVKGEEFDEAVQAATSAAGKDDTLPMLTGVKIEFHSSFLRLIATDRFRIGVREVPWTPDERITTTRQVGSVVVPAKALGEAVRTLQKTKITLGSTAGDNVLGLHTENAHRTLRLMDQQFVPYDRHLVEEFLTTAVVNTTDLATAVKRVSVMAARHAQILLTFCESSVELTAGAAGDGMARQTLPCLLDGAPVTTAFNAGYLIDALNISDPVTVIGMNGPTRAATFRPESAAGIDRHILMPVRLPG